jgi:hypothetical protein
LLYKLRIERSFLIVIGCGIENREPKERDEWLKFVWAIIKAYPNKTIVIYGRRKEALKISEARTILKELSDIGPLPEEPEPILIENCTSVMQCLRRLRPRVSTWRNEEHKYQNTTYMLHVICDMHPERRMVWMTNHYYGHMDKVGIAIHESPFIHTRHHHPRKRRFFSKLKLKKKEITVYDNQWNRKLHLSQLRTR